MKQTDRIKSAGMDRHGPQDDGEKTPTTPLRESHALEDDELVQSVQDKLDGVTSGHEHESIRTSRRNPATDVDDEDDLDLDDTEPEEDDDDLDDDQGSDLDASDDGEEGEEEDEGEEESTGLPDALVRSAVAFGWGTADEAIEYYKQEPQRALEMFNRIYRARIQASSEFARLGQAARQQKQTAQNDPPVRKRVTPEQIEKLKETFGEEAAPLLDIIQTQQQMLDDIKPQTQEQNAPKVQFNEPANIAEHSHIEQQINEFFDRDDMKPWGKVYGKVGFGQDWEDLQPSQQRFRHKVLDKTNNIMGGAQLNGRPVTLPQALEEAHLIVTQQFRDEVLIDNLRSHAVKRSKAISVRPSKSKAKKSRNKSEFGVPGKRTPEQREKAVAARMKRIGL